MNKSQALPKLVSQLTLAAIAGCCISLGILLHTKLMGSRIMSPSAKSDINSTHRIDQSSSGLKRWPKPPRQNPKTSSSKSHEDLAIPWAPTNNIPYHLRYQENSRNLAQVNQFYDIKVFLDQEAAAAFRRMQSAAELDGVFLQAVSGFRSYQDQAALFQQQSIKRGGHLEASRVSAPAGYSEHHTGYVLDIGDMKDQEGVLTLAFERSPVFYWLQQNAFTYGFELSFPKDNRMNVSYEPWHWRFIGSDRAKEIFRSARDLSHAYQRRSYSAPYQPQ